MWFGLRSGGETRILILKIGIERPIKKKKKKLDHEQYLHTPISLTLCLLYTDGPAEFHVDSPIGLF